LVGAACAIFRRVSRSSRRGFTIIFLSCFFYLRIWGRITLKKNAFLFPMGDGSFPGTFIKVSTSRFHDGTFASAVKPRAKRQYAFDRSSSFTVDGCRFRPFRVARGRANDGVNGLAARYVNGKTKRVRIAFIIKTAVETLIFRKENRPQCNHDFLLTGGRRPSKASKSLYASVPW